MTKKSWIWLAGILCSLTTLQVVGAEQDSSQQARKLLEKMIVASRNLNYDGVFVYSRGNQLDTMRIIHKADEDGEVEKLISLTGATREVVKGKDDVTCIYSDNRTVMVDKSGQAGKLLSSNFPESIDRISHFYSFRLLGDDRVAGHDADVIEVVPKDQNRYIYRFWVDRKTNLMLKSAIMDLQGKILETVLFTHIDTLDEIPADMVTPMNASGYSWYTSEKKTDEVQTGSNWKVQWLPHGFLLESVTMQVLSEGQKPMEHRVYSDGLAMISIYIERVDASKEGTKAMNGFVSLGAVNAYTMTHGDHQITVVGELPAKTVYKIASSVATDEKANKSSSSQLLH